MFAQEENAELEDLPIIPLGLRWKVAPRKRVSLEDSQVMGARIPHGISTLSQSAKTIRLELEASGRTEETRTLPVPRRRRTRPLAVASRLSHIRVNDNGNEQADSWDKI